LPREKWGDADAAWLQFYDEEECSLVTGAREALALLEEKGVSTGLVTSGTGERVRRELARLGLDFRAVVCSEDVTHRKPHPEALLAGLARLEAAPVEAAYVGDSPEDVEMAHAAGVFSVGIAGAFPNRRAVRAAAPDLHADDLLNAIRALLNS
jgi:HAD superfamily hydrolase (TIGR01549 family)